jgi:hypothetical protein
LKHHTESGRVLVPNTIDRCGADRISIDRHRRWSHHEALATAAEFVTRFTAVRFSAAQILDDVLDPRLDVRLRGDLTLLAENLNAEAAFNLADVMADLAHACLDPFPALAVVHRCEQLLGVTNRNRIARTRQRRGRGPNS